MAIETLTRYEIVDTGDMFFVKRVEQDYHMKLWGLFSVEGERRKTTLGSYSTLEAAKYSIKVRVKRPKQTWLFDSEGNEI